MREVIITPGDDGWWVSECRSLPGCISQGETKEKAIEGYILALKEGNPPIPELRAK